MINPATRLRENVLNKIYVKEIGTNISSRFYRERNRCVINIIYRDVWDVSDNLDGKQHSKSPIY